MTEFFGTIWGIIAIIFALTIPGYFLCLGFFPSKKEISKLERLVLSMVFSITFWPLLVLVENQLLGIKINFASVAGTLVFMIVMGLIVYAVRIQKIQLPKAIQKRLAQIKKEDVQPIWPF